MVSISNAICALFAASLFHIALSSAVPRLAARASDSTTLARRQANSEGYLYQGYWYKYWTDGGVPDAWLINYAARIVM